MYFESEDRNTSRKTASLRRGHYRGTKPGPSCRVNNFRHSLQRYGHLQRENDYLMTYIGIIKFNLLLNNSSSNSYHRNENI